MLIGFTGASGRTDASHAALLAARALASVEGGATLLVAEPSHGLLPEPDASLDVVRAPPGQGGLAAALSDARRACADRGRVTVVDFPSAWFARDTIRSRLDVVIVVVGPHEADEQGAAYIARRRAHRPGEGRPWYLGCRRAGGSPAAAGFAAAMTRLDPSSMALPFTIPPLGRGEAAALAQGAPGGRTLRLGLLLARAILRVAASSEPDRLPPPDFGVDDAAGIAGADLRSLPDRLRDLADDAEAVATGFGPVPADLAGAPVLDAWAYDVVAMPILKGRVTGHPNIPEGHRVRTSEVFLTDRATWARTLSRWYVLRTPSDAAAPGLQ